jgi:hypothetical protein
MHLTSWKNLDRLIIEDDQGKINLVPLIPTLLDLEAWIPASPLQDWNNPGKHTCMQTGNSIILPGRINPAKPEAT